MCIRDRPLWQKRTAFYKWASAKRSAEPGNFFSDGKAGYRICLGGYEASGRDYHYEPFSEYFQQMSGGRLWCKKRTDSCSSLSLIHISCDPAAIEKTRRVLPIGYWKGSGMSILLDLAGAALTLGRTVSKIGKECKEEYGLTQVFIAVKPELLSGCLLYTSGRFLVGENKRLLPEPVKIKLLKFGRHISHISNRCAVRAVQWSCHRMAERNTGQNSFFRKIYVCKRSLLLGRR